MRGAPSRGGGGGRGKRHEKKGERARGSPQLSNDDPRAPLGTCALRSRPPVEPPKMGDGVFGFSVGGTKGAGVAGAAWAPVSARTENRADWARRAGTCAFRLQPVKLEARIADMMPERGKVWDEALPRCGAKSRGLQSHHWWKNSLQK